MIICHDRRLIFLKGRKVGGTALEIALSTVCAPRDVITPLTPEDEALRRDVGGQGPCHHDRVRWPGTLWTRRVAFRNHSTAAQVRAQVPEAIWTGYRKIAITRDPFDVAISRYHWRRSRGTLPDDMDFGGFVAARRHRLDANSRIAPHRGPDKVDLHLRYSCLLQDLRDNDLSDIAELVARIRPKGGLRPREARVAEVYRAHPEALEMVAEACASEIAAFGYLRPA